MSRTPSVWSLVPQVLLVLVVLVLVVFGEVQSAVADQAWVNLRLRVQWGGGAARLWQGQLALSEGRIQHIQPLGSQSDESAALWLTEGVLYIRPPSPRTYQGVDIVVSAPPTARLELRLAQRTNPPESLPLGPVQGKSLQDRSHTDISLPTHSVSVDLQRIIKSFHEQALDDQGNWVQFRRSPGDRLRAALRPPGVFFTPGQSVEVAFQGHQLGLKAGTQIDYDLALTEPRGGRVIQQLEGVTQTLVAGNGPSATAPPEPVRRRLTLPEQQGVYEIRCRISTRRWNLNPRLGGKWLSENLAERRLQVVVLRPGQAPSSKPKKSNAQILKPAAPSQASGPEQQAQFSGPRLGEGTPSSEVSRREFSSPEFSSGGFLSGEVAQAKVVGRVDPVHPRWWNRRGRFGFLPTGGADPHGWGAAQVLSYDPSDGTGKVHQLLQLGLETLPHAEGQLPWRAFPLRVPHPGKAHVLEIDYPRDVPQRLIVSVGQAAVDSPTIDSGFWVSEQAVLQGPGLATHRVLLWPPTSELRVTVAAGPDSPLAVFGEVRLHELDLASYAPDHPQRLSFQDDHTRGYRLGDHLPPEPWAGQRPAARLRQNQSDPASDLSHSEHSTSQNSPTQNNRADLLSSQTFLAPAAKAASEDDFGAAGVRILASYVRNPKFYEGLLASDYLDGQNRRPITDWQTFYQAAQRLALASKALGRNTVFLTVAADGGTLFPSSIWGPGTRHDSGLLAEHAPDVTQKDVLELVFRVLGQHGIGVVPVVRFDGPIPSLEFLARQKEHASLGLDLVGAEGTSWRRRREGGEPVAFLPPYNPLHWRVRKAMQWAVREVAQRYGHHPGFRGIALELGSGTFAQLPGLAWPLDDQTMLQFARETRVSVPLDGPAKFAQRSRMVSDPEVRGTWLAWRAEKLAQLHEELRQEVRLARPNAELYLVPTDLWAHPETSHTLRHLLPHGGPVADLFLTVGIDPRRYQAADKPKLIRPHAIGPLSQLPHGPLAEELNATGALDGLLAPGEQTGFLMVSAAEPLVLHPDGLGSHSPKNPRSLRPDWLPVEALARRRWTRGLAALDASVFCDGGWHVPVVPQPDCQHLINLIASMPAARFHKISPVGVPVVARKYSDLRRTYFYVVNDFPWPVTAEISLDCSSDVRIDWKQGSTPSTTKNSPADPNSGDPSSGDPNSGDPNSGDPSSGDPNSGVSSSASSGDPNLRASGTRETRAGETSAGVLRLGDGGAAGAIQGIPGLRPVAGHAKRWKLSLQPYDAIGGIIHAPQVRVELTNVDLPPRAHRALQQQVDDLGRRLSQLVPLDDQPSAPLVSWNLQDVLPNAGFEHPGRDGVLPGWVANSQPGVEVDFALQSPHTGRRACRVKSTGPVATVASPTFRPPQTGLLLMAVWIRSPQPRMAAPLRLAVEATRDGKPYYRYAPLGGGPTHPTIGNRWHRYLFGVYDLPIVGLQNLRIRFDLMGAGEVWIDDVQLSSVLLTNPESIHLRTTLATARFALNARRPGDCHRFLAGFWPQVLAREVPLTQRAISPAEDTVPSSPPTELPERPPATVQKPREWYDRLIPQWMK